ncbi:LPXTG cell wall anchor domain-containing protein [Enterococcus sp. LJL128]
MKKIKYGLITSLAVVSCFWAMSSNKIEGREGDSSLKEEVSFYNKVTDEETLDILPSVVEKELLVTVGATGQLQLQSMDLGKNINLVEHLRVVVDNSSLLTVDEQGKWTARQVGETELTIHFEFSEKDMAEIQKNYPDKKIILSDTAQTIKVTVLPEEEFIDITPEFDLEKIDTIINTNGKLSVKPIAGITNISGTFKAIGHDESIIQIADDGTWTALEVGRTSFSLSFTLSKETLQKIQEKYPGKKLIEKAIVRTIDVQINASDTLDVAPSFNIAEIDAKVNASGQILVESIAGIDEVTGTFEASGHDEKIIKIGTDGKWVALAPGTTEFVLNFELSEDTIKAIKEKHPDKELVTRAITQVIKVNVTENQARIIDIFTGFDVTAIEAVVGETGKLNANPIEGIANNDGTFYLEKSNEFISVDENGNWKALKSGKVNLLVAHMPSEKTLAALANTLPEGTELAIPDILTYHQITVTIVDPKPTDDGTKPSGKELPKTGEQSEAFNVYLGFSVVLLAYVIYCKYRITAER